MIYRDFQQALASAQAQPTRVFQALADLAQDIIGVRLFTLMAFDEARNQAQRLYSNRPDAYPVKGTKEVQDDAWARHVLRKHKTFVANSIEDIARVFPDDELIRSLGCESCINIPVLVGGRVIGTLNCLHGKGHYTRERIAQSDRLKLPGAVAFLAVRQLEAGGA